MGASEGVLASLTMMELRSANDLTNMFPSPYEGMEPVQPLSPMLVKGIPVGAESDSDTFKDDSREEWDDKEHGNYSCCPSPLLRMGPTWAEVHAAAQEQEALDRKTPMWDDMMKHAHKDSEDF